MDPLERLIAESEIARLRARYFRALDTKDWVHFAGLFTDGATMEADGHVLGPGGAAIAHAVQEGLSEAETVHRGGNPEIEVSSATTASGVWSTEDLLRWPDGRELHGHGHFHERYERANGSWRIAEIVVTRLRTDVS